MRHHQYVYWGLGHMSHPDDTRSCCGLPEDHRVHRPEYWREGDEVVWPGEGSPANIR